MFRLIKEAKIMLFRKFYLQKIKRMFVYICSRKPLFKGPIGALTEGCKSYCHLLSWMLKTLVPSII